MVDLLPLLDMAKIAALEAGKAILEVYASDHSKVDFKVDGSPITLADRKAHNIIAEGLQQSKLPLLSEEGKHHLFEYRKDWDYFWMVDPLDGTKEFINRSGEFTVNIALINGTTPIAGVVYAPYLDKMYYGSKQTGVYKECKGKCEQLQPVSAKRSFETFSSKETVVIVASKSHSSPATAVFINQFPNVSLTSLGSSLKLMLIAEGAADIYPRLAPTLEWDTAAGHALLNGLNKGVFQTDLKTEITYNKENLLNPSFIAY